ncbi:MAG: Response regulator [Fibrobacteres bacterium]|nr:Response regulator [Fibrobacterota bacterium]
MSYSGMPFGLDARSTFFVCLALGIGLIVLAIGLKIRLRNRMRIPRRPGPIIDRDKLVVLVCQGEKIIESGIAGVFISLDKFFRDIGFSVVVASNLRRFDEVLQEGVPVIIGIDCRLGPKAMRKIDTLCRACFGVRGSVVFFYNAAHPEKLSPPPSLPQATYLGESFAGIQVLELISYAISVEANAPRPAETGREPCSLEGKNVGHALPEIFQFLEMGRRTGMLSVEDGNPAGVISFEQGAITFAQTRLNEGMEAVMEILAVTGGTFHFFENKRVMQSNCRLSAQEALMQWACRVDEDGNAVPRSLI